MLLLRKNTAKIVPREVITTAPSLVIFDYGTLLQFKSSKLAAYIAG